MGIITEIQQFSLHDGPGIRTTVFFKGCNLRCKWCHNPETFKPEPEWGFYKNLCRKCDTCTGNCHARKLFGKEKTSAEVVAKVAEDKIFYNKSGGGVTLSGGEVMLQPHFAAEILQGCREQNIHTCIESNMTIPIQNDVIDLCDLVIMDIKTLDDDKHRYWTGASNKTVLANYKILENIGKPVIVRTPIITGVNDTEEDIRQIAKYIAGNKTLVTYELMPYHNLGAGKWEALNIPYRTFTPPTDAKMAELVELIQA